jgi:hypothetical protein
VSKLLARTELATSAINTTMVFLMVPLLLQYKFNAVRPAWRETFQDSTGFTSGKHFGIRVATLDDGVLISDRSAVSPIAAVLTNRDGS